MNSRLSGTDAKPLKVVLATSYWAPWPRRGDRGRGRARQGSCVGACYTDDNGSVPGCHEEAAHRPVRSQMVLEQ